MTSPPDSEVHEHLQNTTVEIEMLFLGQRQVRGLVFAREYSAEDVPVSIVRHTPLGEIQVELRQVRERDRHGQMGPVNAFINTGRLKLDLNTFDDRQITTGDIRAQAGWGGLFSISVEDVEGINKTDVFTLDEPSSQLISAILAGDPQ